MSLNSRTLRCEECRREPDLRLHAAGWVAFRVDLPDDPAPPTVVAYCPQCAAREFDESPHALAEDDASWASQDHRSCRTRDDLDLI